VRAEHERQGVAGDAAVEVTTVGDIEQDVQREAERDQEPPTVDPDRDDRLDRLVPADAAESGPGDFDRI